MILSSTGNSELYVSDQYGRNLKQLTKNRGVEASPSWSPDGKQIVFTSDTMGGPQIFTIAASGGPLKHLSTHLSGYVEEPNWNKANPNLIVFTGMTGGSLQLGIYDLKTKKAQWLTSGPGDCGEPIWLNDGRHIIYTRTQNKQSGLRVISDATREAAGVRPVKAI